MQAVIGKQYLIFNKTAGTGAIPDPRDARDLPYAEVAMGAAPVDWGKGYDVEGEIGDTLKIKNQDGSSSCVGQGWAYQIAVLDTVENGFYNEVSAKVFYSQIHLAGGGAYVRDGAKLAVNFGALSEMLVPSYDNGKPPSESFMTKKDWMSPELEALAKKLQAKEYRKAENSMDMIATAIRDNHGCVGGVMGENNGTWKTFEPKPPKNGGEWGHCIYFGKFGVDKLGKFISTPNSWGSRGEDQLHQDGWQKLREDYFNDKHMFNPWTLVDKPNFAMSPETQKLMIQHEKHLIMEGEGVGRKGIIVDGLLRQILDPTNNRAAAACLYLSPVKFTVTSKIFNEMLKGDNF